MTDEYRHFEFEQAVARIDELRQQLNHRILGQADLITETLCCFLAGGNLLITGAPGLAKTTLVKVIARMFGLKFARIQFTPDLLPSDIVGSEILNIDPESGKRHFEFAKGPVFANFILADEINRASPRTQSALLEAMQEKTVTVAGRQHILPKPFMVFATQNPFESEGTFPLPEAQIDRFLLHALITYPHKEAEIEVLRAHVDNVLIGEGSTLEEAEISKLTIEEVTALFAHTQSVRVPDEVVFAINELVRSTRPTDDNCPELLRKGLWYGAGPRAGLSLVSAAKALALLEGQVNVTWKHVKRLAPSTLRHRIRVTAAAGREQWNADRMIQDLIERFESRHKNLATGKGS